MRHTLLLLVALAAPAGAEVMPVPSREDPRVQFVRFARDQVVQLHTSPGNQLTVMLAPGERISDVRVSNNALYQVTLSEARDSFLLHTSMVQLGAPTGNGTITIGSERGTYQFAIYSTPQIRPPYIVRFTYDQSEQASLYRLTGNRALRPTAIRDDGLKTYIEWGPDQLLPAVFALDRVGREEMVDGYMRNGVFTIDRVHERLVFRIDSVKAEARRRAGKAAE